MAGKQVFRSLQGREAHPQARGTSPQPSPVTAPVVVPLRVTERRAALLAMGEHPMFAALAHDQLQRLLSAGRTEQLVAGQVLYSRGEASARFFLVLEGQVNLSLHSRDGGEKIIDIQGPGQVFAEAVAFMARPVYQMTATAATAATAARVLGIPNPDYVETLLGNPKACRQVLRHLSSRLHLRIREIEGITLESATARRQNAGGSDGHRANPADGDPAGACLLSRDETRDVDEGVARARGQRRSRRARADH